MNRRRIALVVGIVAFGLGIAGVLDARLAAFDLDEIALTAIGLGALVQALRVANARRKRDRHRSTLPDVEIPLSAPPPGEDLDAALSAFADRRRTHYRGARAHTALEAAAVATLTRFTNVDEEAAASLLAAGTWTDDDYAAAFLGADDREPSVRTRVLERVRGESRFERDVRHTVDAITGLAEPSLDLPAGGERDSRPRRRAAHGPRVGSPVTRSFEAIGRATGTAVENGIAARAPATTDHWFGISAVSFLALGGGVVAERPALVLASIVGIGFAAYARSASAPTVVLDAERVVETDRPEPDSEVEVTLTVTNAGERPLVDLRVLDGVPDALAVLDGSPRLGTALRSGESVTLSYTIGARRGAHAFGPVSVIARDMAGTSERELFLECETTIEVYPRPRAITEPVPLRTEATGYAGQVTTASGGAGLEFHAIREHRPGDPMNRIDWARRARTGEFATLEFREERSVSVLILVDTREAAHVAPVPGVPHAVDRSVDAAGRILTTLLDRGDRVGLAAYGPGECWLAPGSGRDHHLRARERLGTHPAFGSLPVEERFRAAAWNRALRRRLRPDTQVLFCTPLCDEYAATIARRFDARGHPVTVCSVDPTSARTPATRLTGLARTLRISALRRAGLRVIDWSWENSLDATLARANERSVGE